MCGLLKVVGVVDGAVCVWHLNGFHSPNMCVCWIEHISTFYRNVDTFEIVLYLMTRSNASARAMLNLFTQLGVLWVVALVMKVYTIANEGLGRPTFSGDGWLNGNISAWLDDGFFDAGWQHAARINIGRRIRWDLSISMPWHIYCMFYQTTLLPTMYPFF